MTSSTFKWQVVGVCCFLLFVSVVSIYASYIWVDYKDAYRSIPIITIPIGAAWLAFCWQRRVAFTKALFDVWQKLVVTIQDAIQYTHLTAPTQNDFAKVMHGLSGRIDDIRGAFRNVGELRLPLTIETKAYILSIKNSKTLLECDSHTVNYRNKYKPDIGKYPFESLKQIQHVFSLIGYGQSFDAAHSALARRTINALWGILRAELLKELDRDVPVYADTPFDP